MEKAEGCWHLRESPALLSAGFAVPGRQSQDCLPPAAGAGKPLTREQLSTMSLGNSLLLHSQAHNPFSVSAVSARYHTSEHGSSLGTKAARRSLEGPQHWSQRAATQSQLEMAGRATAISFRGTVAWPYSPGLLGPPVLSAEASYSPSPSKGPTKGNGLLQQHVRFRLDLRKSFLASHT